VDFQGTMLSLSSLELPRLEAVIELMFLAAYADETITPEERTALRAQVVNSTGGSLGPETVEAILTSIEAALSQQGREARFESIRRRLGDDKMRRAALVTAARILHADHDINSREAAWMIRAARALQIPEEEAIGLLRQPPTE